MPCATRGPAHKLCRSLPTAARKGIHSHASPPPFPIPQRFAHRSRSRGQGHTQGHIQTLPHTTTLREAMSLTPDREGPGREYTCERRPLRRPRAAEDVKIPIVPPAGCEHVPLQPSLNRRTPPYVRLRFQT